MKRFPVATHSYFKVTNVEEARSTFLNSKQKTNPLFAYKPHFNNGLVAARLEELSNSAEPDPAALRSLETVLSACKLQQAGTAANVADFRKKNTDSYGEPRADYLAAILGRIKSAVKPETRKYWSQLTTLVEVTEPASAWPDDDLFKEVSRYGKKYMRDLLRSTKGKELPQLIEQVIRGTGLREAGWQLKLTDDSAPARVVHESKIVSLGRRYRHRNTKARLRIVAHELYGHALRGRGADIHESEGFAIIMEQALDLRFKPRRTYRYLAAAVAWGVDGAPRDFSQTFEIVWRAMVILSKYSVAAAQRHAFDECVRIFRGGRPDIPGAVYLKDTVYFSANIEIWQWFAHTSISYNDFVDIATGKRRALQ